MKQLIEKLRKGKKSSRKTYERDNYVSDVHRLIVVRHIPNNTEAYRLISLDGSGVDYQPQEKPDLEAFMKARGLEVMKFRKLEKKDDETVEVYTTFIGDVDIFFDDETNEYSCSADLYNPGLDLTVTVDSGPGVSRKIALSRFFSYFNRQYKGCRLEIDDTPDTDEESSE